MLFQDFFRRNNLNYSISLLSGVTLLTFGYFIFKKYNNNNNKLLNNKKNFKNEYFENNKNKLNNNNKSNNSNHSDNNNNYNNDINNINNNNDNMNNNINNNKPHRIKKTVHTNKSNKFNTIQQYHNNQNIEIIENNNNNNNNNNENNILKTPTINEQQNNNDNNNFEYQRSPLLSPYSPIHFTSPQTSNYSNISQNDLILIYNELKQVLNEFEHILAPIVEQVIQHSLDEQLEQYENDNIDNIIRFPTPHELKEQIMDKFSLKFIKKEKKSCQKHNIKHELLHEITSEFEYLDEIKESIDYIRQKSLDIENYVYIEVNKFFDDNPDLLHDNNEITNIDDITLENYLLFTQELMTAMNTNITTCYNEAKNELGKKAKKNKIKKYCVQKYYGCVAKVMVDVEKRWGLTSNMVKQLKEKYDNDPNVEELNKKCHEEQKKIFSSYGISVAH